MGEYDRKPTKAAGRATAGPSADDRFGAGKVGVDVQGRIMKADVVDGRTRVTIARGTANGVHRDMEGYVKGAGGMLAELRVVDVREGMCFALVDVTLDELGSHHSVVINPSSMPRATITKNTTTRVLAVTSEGGRTKIIIARGSAHGVSPGMRGELSSGATFTIEGTTAKQSFGYVAESVDHVNAHQNVVLHPDASPRGGAIQRRADGASGTGDVQSTAQAGVAGASSRLPYLDVIQRSFGKHDVSGIQAQVGGAATAASHALGAKAYATGSKVAFAAAPDLHTAAHEAAHTIQQQRGAVGFQGLGAADDEHERHADAVADAVVAGRSAEALLDRINGTVDARSEGAIQRKATPSSEQTRIDVIRLSLRNAQHELEKWDGARDPAKVILDARMHLAEASAALVGSGLSPAQIESLQPQMEATTRAVQEVVRMHGDRPPVTQLKDQAVKLRMLLRLDPDLTTSYATGEIEKSNKGRHDETEVAGPLVELVRIEAQAGYEQLVEIDLRKADGQPDERGAIVAAITGKLQHHVVYAHALLGEQPAVARTLAPKIAAASAPIQQIRAWIFSRQDNAKLLQLFDRVLHEVDALRATAGLGSLAKEPIPALARASVEGAHKEHDAVTEAQQKLVAAIKAKFTAFQMGADRLKTTAKMDPPSPKPSFWEELAKGILISVIGNVIGPAVGALVRASAREMTEASLGFVAGATTDSVQAIASKIADGAFARAVSANDRVRNIQLFYEGLVLTQAECVRAAEVSITSRVSAKTISAAELVAMREDIAKANLYQVADMTFEHAAHGFVLLTAQQRLGLQNREGDQVSAMEGYFGKPMGGSRFGESMIGGKTGTEGVGRLRVAVFDNGDLAGYRIEKFALNGMVDDLAEAVLVHAGYRMDKLGIPIEIEIEPPTSGREARAFLAIDERGELRGSKNWSALQQAHARARNADFYASPEKMWQSLRHDPLPKSIVEKG